MRIVRLLRGITLTAVTWSATWVVAFAAMVGITVLSGARIPPREYWDLLLIRTVVSGAINGTAFALFMATFGRRYTLATLRPSLVTLGGAIGGAVFPILTLAAFVAARRASAIPNLPLPVIPLLGGAAFNSVLGALCARTSLRLARRGAPAELPRAEAGKPDPAAGALVEASSRV